MSEAPPYCAYYCEENIWQLCADERLAGCERRVLIISNSTRRVAMWGQRLSVAPEKPLVWDYHVILLVGRARLGATQTTWEAWDLDARLPSPRPAKAWLDHSFGDAGLLPPEFAPRFRLVSCADYRRYFRSDRRHMLRPDGSAKQPPPSWPPILGEHPPGTRDDGSNLDRFLDCEDSDFLGQLFTLPELRAWLASSDAPG